METNPSVIFLHGFLGSPEDCPPSLLTLGPAVGPDWTQTLLSGGEPAKGFYPLEGLADALATECGAGPHLLIGYSMGGRIAMHMLTRHPGLFFRAVIISASPGFATAREKTARLDADQKWAARFRNDPWPEVMREWNRLPVFSGDGEFHFERPTEPGGGEKWARVMDWGSVGRQADLRPALANLPVPVLFLAGTNDAKYAHLTAECARLNPRFRSKLIDGAGHRLPWSHPTEFQLAIQSFLAEAID